jgi:hypothetical protein
MHTVLKMFLYDQSLCQVLCLKPKHIHAADDLKNCIYWRFQHGCTVHQVQDLIEVMVKALNSNPLSTGFVSMFRLCRAYFRAVSNSFGKTTVQDQNIMLSYFAVLDNYSVKHYLP